jgi:hypothetical protein
VTKDTREGLIESGHFAALRERNRRFMHQIEASLAAGEIRNHQFMFAELMRRRLGNGCIALMLGEADACALEDFGAAVGWALKLIGAPRTSGGGLRVYEANVELSEEGSRLKALHEREPLPGEEKLSITDYHSALISVTSFGEQSQFETVASVPQEAYQNPGTITATDYWMRVRAWKALLLGQDAEARREAEQAFARGSGSGKPEAAALLALLDRYQDRFKQSLQDVVKQYVKATSKQVNDPITAVCFPGLMLCRVAVDRGMSVKDAPYLPVRLLPNYYA